MTLLLCAALTVCVLVLARQSQTTNRALRALLLEMTGAREWVGVEDLREATGYHVTRWQFSLLLKQLEGEGLVETRPWPVLVGSRQFSARKCRRRGGAAGR